MFTQRPRRIWFARYVEARTWFIKDFKSVEYSEVNLQNGHLTVLTGPNSIGKSSVLQSILMLCQSFNSYGDELVLNGGLAKLGLPEEVVRDGCDSCSIGIEYMFNRGGRHVHSDSVSDSVKCEISLFPSEVQSGEVVTSTLSIGGLRLESSDSTFVFQKTKEDNDVVEIRDKTPLNHMLDSADLKDMSFLRAVPQHGEELKRTYVVFHGLLPIAIVKLRSQKEAFDWYRRDLRDYIDSGLRDTGWERMSYRYLRMLTDKLSTGSDDDAYNLMRLESRDGMREFSNRLGTLPPKDLDAVLDTIAKELSEERPYVFESIDGPASRFDYDLSSNEGAGYFHRLHTLLGGLVAAMMDIAEEVVYIGPLRDDPRVISPLVEETGSNIPIGIKGERAAVVLWLHSQEKRYFRLPYKKHGDLTLGQAVSKWADYLGVASEINASSMQKLGTRINLNVGGSSRDLTQVGVGASQAIPIIVGILTAKRGSTVIIEQPELHLHPSAQARLADFFLYARPDISIVIESHSEALITRLRRRVVEDERLSKRINIQFFEKSSDGGVVGHNLGIDAFGNLDAWPSGFMDAVQEDSRIILRSAIAKRKKMRGNGGQ